MTGKEALKEWIDHYRIDCHKYCGDSFLENLKIVEEYLEELEVENVYLKEQLEFSGLLEYETKKELTKYERALDIFKRLLDDDFTYGGFADGRLLIDGAIDITDGEKELLEELMKSE